jgi:SAM-dependent methyltransferase
MAQNLRAPHGGAELDRMSSAHNYNAWLLERARPYLGPRVLDVGAGIGTFTAELARLADSVVALEPDPEEAQVLRTRFAHDARVSVLQQTAADLPADEAPFDAAICFNVLEHVREDVEALRAVHARLRPGGHLLLLVPAHPALYGETDRAVDHVRRYDRPTLRRAVEGADFQLVELRHVNPVGAVGWAVSSRLLRRREIPAGPLALYDRLVPVLKALDRLRLPLGLSLWAVARTPAPTR